MEDAVADGELRGRVHGRLGDEFALDRLAARAALAIADAFHLMAGAGAPVVSRGVGAVGLRALPAGCRIGVLERLLLVEAGLAVRIAPVAAVIGALAFRDFNMVQRQFFEEARGDGRLPQAVNASVRHEPDMGTALGAGEADIGEAAFFLQPRSATFVQRALVGKQAFFPAGEEDGLEFQTLRRMQRHDVDGIQVLVLLRIHDEGDMFEEAA